MPSIDLNDYYYFVHVVEKGGFTRASESLGIPKSRLSRHIVQLEERLDTILIQRTTRQSKITESGEVFYRRARTVVDQVELAEAELKRKKNTLSGQVTLSCSVGVAQFALKELIARFMTDNPQITVLQQVTNQNIDLIASGVDMSIRGHTGFLPDSTLIQRSLAVVEWSLFTSPDYPVNKIATPQDLKSHQTLSLGWQGHGGRWRLEHKSGMKEEIRITPRLKSDDMATLKEAAGEGLGIVALPAYTCRDELASGKLIKVLPEWHAGQANLSLMMPRKSGFDAPVVALQEFLQTEFTDFVAMY
ncbi:MAG: LysR family transcriptional regulator [Gammaproteobacteria bacterium]|nr:LysR family transcriptional regulator [Gammaproteobacteria bacterium]MAY03914.1 LysR family transcriptional regulator [Gammaproteobacteria bacterium]|tara:strand:+ start:49562 stop:50470 length:909 start_codon:yes stop_codon:yes gene_type:complete